MLPDPNEGLKEKPGRGGCPDGMVPVSDYCVDQYEASLVEVETGKNWSPFHNPGHSRKKLKAVSFEGAIPQGYISGDQAKLMCHNAGKRLCSDYEWLRACQGPDGKMFPYGGFFPRDRFPKGTTEKNSPCNQEHGRLHPALELFGHTKKPFDRIGDACINQLPDTVARTGSFPLCVTSEGVYDMMGNEHEWTANPAGRFRGGFFMDTKINGKGCFYVTTAHNTKHWDYSTGFRCCANLPK